MSQLHECADELWESVAAGRILRGICMHDGRIHHRSAGSKLHCDFCHSACQESSCQVHQTASGCQSRWAWHSNGFIGSSVPCFLGQCTVSTSVITVMHNSNCAGDSDAITLKMQEQGPCSPTESGLRSLREPLPMEPNHKCT